MHWEYKVVWTVDVIPAPHFWQTPSSKVKEYVSGMEDLLHRMAAEGWELVSTCGEPSATGIYLFFRRPRDDRPGRAEETAIKE